MVAGPDGGAWAGVYSYERARIIRVMPQGAIRPTPVEYLGDGGLGPDGQAWFVEGRGVTRIDAGGVKTAIPVENVPFGQLTTGPDGTAWLTGNEVILRVAPDGTVAPTPLTVPNCPEFRPYVLARASDGAMWFGDLCGLVRLPAGGTPTVVAKPERVLFPRKLVPDPHGGVWFSTDREPGGGHVDAAGRLTLLKSRDPFGMQDVAVAPDGSTWFAGGKCTISRAGADGTLTTQPTAIPAWHVGFDPAGGLWLGSLARLQHTTLDAPAGRCDDTPPSARVVPDPSKPVSLATLRRQGGFKITLREPFAIEGYVFDSDADETIAGVDRAVTARGGRTVRLATSPRLLRRIARHTGQPLGLTADIRDREGNYASLEYELRFKP
ncbi:hypothetical protein OJ998_18780 [Solirubrobacter taibaiensis]|nr:hypothetical protein [Solirubrobacter taibaiensis]